MGEGESWRRIRGGGSMEEESWRRNREGGILEESGKYLGGIWGLRDPSLRHLGNMWDASGETREASGGSSGLPGSRSAWEQKYWV